MFNDKSCKVYIYNVVHSLDFVPITVCTDICFLFVSYNSCRHRNMFVFDNNESFPTSIVSNENFEITALHEFQAKAFLLSSKLSPRYVKDIEVGKMSNLS